MPLSSEERGGARERNLLLAVPGLAVVPDAIVIRLACEPLAKVGASGADHEKVASGRRRLRVGYCVTSAGRAILLTSVATAVGML
jgi:hypothetical protein